MVVSESTYLSLCACVCVSVCVQACLCVCVCASVPVVFVCVCVSPFYFPSFICIPSLSFSSISELLPPPFSLSSPLLSSPLLSYPLFSPSPLLSSPPPLLTYPLLSSPPPLLSSSPPLVPLLSTARCKSPHHYSLRMNGGRAEVTPLKSPTT